jgi:hypothetical protein
MKNLDMKKRILIAAGILVALIITFTLGFSDIKEATLPDGINQIPANSFQQGINYLSKHVLFQADLK